MQSEIKNILNLIKPGHTVLVKYDVLTPALAFLLLTLEHYSTDKRYFVFWNKITARKVKNFVRSCELIRRFFEDAEIVVVGDVNMEIGKTNEVEPSEDAEDLIDKVFDLICRKEGVVFNFGLHYLRYLDEAGTVKGLTEWIGDMEKHVNFIFIPARFLEDEKGYFFEYLPDLVIYLRTLSEELLFDKSTYQFEIRHSMIPKLMPTSFSFVVREDFSID
jgi:hypothetical protein